MKHEFTDWRRKIADQLAPHFDRSLTDHVEYIVEDLGHYDLFTRRRAAAQLLGLTRRVDLAVRLDLVEILMTAWSLTPTQHSARLIMEEVFGIAASTAALTKRFSKPGRNAKTKFAPAAREALAQADPRLLGAIREERDWAMQRLRSCIDSYRR